MKDVQQRLYEGMYIFNATLSEDARQKALDKILQGIKEKNGEVNKILDMGRRRLAYEIEKKRDGYYYVLYFTIAPSMIKELWKEHQLHEDLLRFCTMQVEKIRENLEFTPLKEIPYIQRSPMV